MAKLTRNSYKRKVILFGVILFASIALISTGFAAWVMSTNAKEKTPGNIAVGQVKDSKLTISDLKLTNTSFLFEPQKDDDSGRVRYDKEEADKFESLSTTVTAKIKPTEYLGTLKVYLVVSEGVKNAVEKGYITLPEWAVYSNDLDDIASAELVTTTGTKGKEIVLTQQEKDNGTYQLSLEITLGWGSKFNNENPGIYFDSKDAENISDEEVKTMLEDFRAVLYGYDKEIETAQNNVKTTNPGKTEAELAAELQQARDNVIAAHANDDEDAKTKVQFKVIVTAEAN